MVSILCIQKDSNYKLIPGLDLWDELRDAYNFSGSNPVITHAPCSQWSRMKHFAKKNKREKELAYFCFEKVNQNGGIFEHPSGSSFFRSVNADRRKIISVNQCWWGFPARKKTLLYFNGCEPGTYPISFDYPLATVCTSKRHSYAGKYELRGSERSLMPLPFCQWLVNHFPGEHKQ